MSEPAGPGGLDALRGQALALLAHGCADRRSPAHTPTVATVDGAGAPRLRTVVLRGFDPSGPTLRFHTDVRTPKWADLKARPDVAVHVYDAAAKLQIRLNAQARLHAGDAVADAAWAESRPMSRICYGTRPAPGTEIAEADAFTLPGQPEEIEASRMHFGVVLCRVEAMEVLHLAAAGHRRALFTWSGPQATGRWLAP